MSHCNACDAMIENSQHLMQIFLWKQNSLKQKATYQKPQGAQDYGYVSYHSFMIRAYMFTCVFLHKLSFQYITMGMYNLPHKKKSTM